MYSENSFGFAGGLGCVWLLPLDAYTDYALSVNDISHVLIIVATSSYVMALSASSIEFATSSVELR